MCDLLIITQLKHNQNRPEIQQLSGAVSFVTLLGNIHLYISTKRRRVLKTGLRWPHCLKQTLGTLGELTGQAAVASLDE